MSAAAGINSVQSALINNSSSFRALAESLVADAQDLISNTTAYSPAPIVYQDPQRQPTITQVTPVPPEIETDHYEIPPIPPMTPLENVPTPDTVEYPDINLPGKVFDPTILKQEYSEQQFTGDLESLGTEPDYGLIGSEPIPPTLTIPVNFSADPLSGGPPEPPIPSMAEFDESFIPLYEQGLERSEDELDQFRAWFSGYQVPFDQLHDSFASYLQQILAQSAWSVGVVEPWHTLAYQQGIQPVQAERYQALRGLDQTPTAITGLPTGLRSYEYLKFIDQSATQHVEALAKVDQELRNREFELLKFGLINSQQLIKLALSLRGQQLGWMIQAQKVVVDGIDGVVQLTLGAAELKEKEINLKSKYNDLQMRRLLAMMDVEKTKIDSIKISLESEKLKSDYNVNSISAYQVAIDLTESRVEKWRIQIEYSQIIKRLDLLKLEVLKTDIQQFSANLNLFKLQQQLASLQSQEDKVFVDAEIQVYEAILVEIRQQALRLNAQVENEKTAAAELQQEAALYNAKVGGFIKEFEMISKTSDIAAKAISAGAKAEHMGPQLDMMEQDFKDTKILQEKIFEIADQKFDEIVNLKRHQLDVEKNKARAQAQARAASVAGGIAANAFAGLNAVGTSIFKETV